MKIATLNNLKQVVDNVKIPIKSSIEELNGGGNLGVIHTDKIESTLTEGYVSVTNLRLGTEQEFTDYNEGTLSLEDFTNITGKITSIDLAKLDIDTNDSNPSYLVTALATDTEIITLNSYLYSNGASAVMFNYNDVNYQTHDDSGKFDQDGLNNINEILSEGWSLLVFQNQNGDIIYENNKLEYKDFLDQFFTVWQSIQTPEIPESNQLMVKTENGYSNLSCDVIRVVNSKEVLDTLNIPTGSLVSLYNNNIQHNVLPSTINKGALLATNSTYCVNGDNIIGINFTGAALDSSLSIPYIFLHSSNESYASVQWISIDEGKILVYFWDKENAKAETIEEIIYENGTLNNAVVAKLNAELANGYGFTLYTNQTTNASSELLEDSFTYETIADMQTYIDPLFTFTVSNGASDELYKKTDSGYELVLESVTDDEIDSLFE